jgi:hypothetical protein
MTLAELVETNGHISLITATVRGTKTNEYERVCEYRIGSRAEYYPGDYRSGRDNEPDQTVHLIQKPIHCRDDGAASFEFGQIMKHLPIKIRNLQVTRWTCGYEIPMPWSCGERPHHLRCDLLSEEWSKKNGRKELQR